jgi:WD40 repeat protein
MARQGSHKVLGVPLASLSVVLCLLSGCTLPQPLDSPIPRIEAGMHTAPARQPLDTPFLCIEAGMHTAPIRAIDVDAQARFLVTASDDKTARLWSLASGELLKVLRPPIGTGNEGKLYAVAISPDGETVAAAGWTKAGIDFHNIYLFGRASGRLQRRISGLPEVIHHLAYAPNGRYLAATLGKPNGIRLYDTRDYREIARDSDYGDRSNWAEFDRRGRLVTSSYDGDVRLYDAQFKRIARRKAPGGERPFAVRFSPDGTLVAVGFDDTRAVNVLSGEDLSFRNAPDTGSVASGNLLAVAWSRDGQRLYAGGRYRDSSGICPILQWSQAGRGPVTRLPAATNTVIDLRTLANGRLVFGAQDPAFGVFDAQDTKKLTRRPAQVEYSGRHADLRLSHHGSIVEFAYDTLTSENRWARHSARVNLAEGRVLVDPPALQKALGLVDLTPPRNEGLPIKEWRNSYKPTLDGTPLALAPYEISRVLAISPDGERFLLGTEWNLRLFDRWGKQIRRLPTPSVTRAVNIGGDGRVAVAAFGDGTLRWYRLRDGAELLALFLHTDGSRWVLWTPEGFFTSSPGGEAVVGYHLDQGPDTAGEFVTVEQLYRLYSRPELVARRLEEGIDTELQAALARIGDVRQVLAAGLPPTLELLSPPESQQRTREFTLQIKIAPSTGGVGRIVYRVNGVVVGDLTARPVDISVPYHRRPFTLAPGRNVISATAFNAQNTVESTPVDTVVHVHAGERRPTLYVLALGVSDYRDRALQLRYAADDAKALVDTLRRQGQRLFARVEVTSLLDRDVTLGKLEAAFRDLAGKVQADDVFIIYLAGHGMTLDGEYHFIPADVIYENAPALRAGSVPQERLQRWLGAIQAQKSLVLLDTCASGAFVTALSGTVTQLASARDLSEKGAIDKLMRATGRAVIAASTERQFALEGHSGHGVFTYALLQGLRGEADAQGDRDGAITVDELSAYVAKEVPRITLEKWKYEQFPMRQFGGLPFPIGLVP